MIVKPHVDWFALAPSLALLAASGLLLMVAVFVPRRGRKATSAFVAFAGFVASGIWAAFLDDRSPNATALVHDAMWRDRWGALAQVILAGAGRRRRAPLVRRADARRARRRVLRAPHGRRRRHGVLRAGREPDDAVPRARVVLDRALRADRDRHRPRRVARGGAQVPGHRRGRLGDAAVRLRARVRHHRRALVRPDRRDRARARRDARRRARDDHRRARVQGVGGAVPHVDAGRLPGRTDAGDRVHGVGDEDRRARRHLPRARRPRSRTTSTSGASRSP